MKSGKIVLVHSKGYGFIEQDEPGSDMFFHVSGLAEGTSFDLLRVGMRVTYEVDTTPDRPRAVNVTVVDEKSQGSQQADGA